MGVVLFRIDDRLIHGQVVESWIPHLKAEEAVVVSEEAVGSEITQMLMRLSLPAEIRLKILPVSQALKYLLEMENSARRILVLVPGPKEALALIRGGIKIPAINVGGMHYSAGKAQLGRAIFLGEEDCRDLMSIAGLGVRLEGRGVPSDTPSNITQMIGSSSGG